MDPETEVREYLESQCGFFQLYQGHGKFTGYRKTSAGVVQEVTIEVLDMGPNQPIYRYIVEAESDDGKKTRCNGGPTIAEALRITHWQRLD